MTAPTKRQLFCAITSALFNFFSLHPTVYSNAHYSDYLAP